MFIWQRNTVRIFWLWSDSSLSSTWPSIKNIRLLCESSLVIINVHGCATQGGFQLEQFSRWSFVFCFHGWPSCRLSYLCFRSQEVCNTWFPPKFWVQQTHHFSVDFEYTISLTFKLCVAVLIRLDLLELDYPSGLWLWLAAVYPLISGPSHSVECECISFHLLLNYVYFLSYYYFQKSYT